MRYCGGAMISHTQFLFTGYSSGKLGLVIVPFETSNTPPQASVTLEAYSLLWMFQYPCVIWQK